jgi:hypothetical protein
MEGSSPEAGASNGSSASSRRGLRTTRQLDFAAWASYRAGLLGAPESGLPLATARPFLVNLEHEVGTAHWPSVADGLTEARGTRADYAVSRAKEIRPDLDLDGEELVDEIDSEYVDWPWKRVKEAAAEASNTSRRQRMTATRRVRRTGS